MSNRLKIIRNKAYKEYCRQQPITIEKHLNRVKKRLFESDFKFYFVSSSCNSSMIEGSSLTEDDYMRFKEAGIITKDVREVDDMIEAYRFAQRHKPTMRNILSAHKLVAKHFSLPEKYKGKFRDVMVNVWDGRKIVYRAARTEIVGKEMEKLVSDIELLTSRNLSLQQVFYYAAMIHLVFVSIHPFADGNGRMARLLEKWFLASKIGDTAWRIQSEKLYYTRRSSYYAKLGFRSDYSTIDYDKSIPFLLMLPMALRVH